MILSDKSIRRGLRDGGMLEVEPQPFETQIQPASLDVRLGEKLYNVDDDVTIEGSPTHVLHPDTRYIGHTIETVDLPNDIAAQLTGRSTIGRMGIIVHKTAGFIDPGFSGEVTLELYNLSDSAVRLDVGQRIGQLVFMPLDRPSSGYDGKYQNQSGVQTAVVDDE